MAPAHIRAVATCVACGVLALAGGAGAQDAGGAVDAATAIRAIDFHNGNYHVHMLHLNVQLRDGVWQRHPPGDTENYDSARIESIVYGDLDGDGVEEAAIYVAVNPAGGTGDFTSVDVFACDHGQARHLASIDEGDRGDGGIDEIEIRDRRLRVRRFHTQMSAGNPDWTEVQVLELVGHQLVERSVGERQQIVEDPRSRNPRIRDPLRIALSAGFPRGVRAESHCLSTPPRTQVRWRARAGEHFALAVTLDEHIAGTVLVTGADGGELARGVVGTPLAITAATAGDLTAEVRCAAAYAPATFILSR